MFAVSYPGNPRIGLESRRLGAPMCQPDPDHVVVADEVRFENEVIGNAVGEVGLVHPAASIGFGAMMSSSAFEKLNQYFVPWLNSKPTLVRPSPFGML